MTADNADVVRICSKAEVSPGAVRAFAFGSWRDGWLIDAVGSAAGVTPALRRLKTKPFRERPIKLIAGAENGGPTVQAFEKRTRGVSISHTGAFRAVKFIILAIAAVPVVGVVAVLLWLGTIWAAYNYKWGWLEVPVHYRLTFGVEVGGVATSAQSPRGSVSSGEPRKSTL